MEFVNANKCFAMLIIWFAHKLALTANAFNVDKLPEKWIVQTTKSVITEIVSALILNANVDYSVKENTVRHQIVLSVDLMNIVEKVKDAMIKEIVNVAKANVKLWGRSVRTTMKLENVFNVMNISNVILINLA